MKSVISEKLLLKYVNSDGELHLTTEGTVLLLAWIKSAEIEHESIRKILPLLDHIKKSGVLNDHNTENQ